MKIVSLNKNYCKDAANVVARAFYHYPSLVTYFPDERRRAKNLPWYMERVLRSALAYGEVWTTEDRAGVLFLLPPGHTRLTDWEYVRCGFLASPLKIGLRHYPVVNACENTLAETQERLLGQRPHYYLWGLTVDPARQRSGAGTALLQQLFLRAEQEQMPIYLETHKLENVTYYEARGFRLIFTGEMPDHSPFWCMLREPENKPV
jgi:ribosomal protein S18 acetylase RimI-like enzyme